MPRLFTGLEIPAEIGQTLSNLRGGLPGARWIDPENYHVTLRFIGDIDGVAANEIASLLFRVNRKPFEVALQGLSSFGGRKPRAVACPTLPMPLTRSAGRITRKVSTSRRSVSFKRPCGSQKSAEDQKTRMSTTTWVSPTRRPISLLWHGSSWRKP